MKNSQKNSLVQLATVFAIFANIPHSQAELVIQIYYQSHQIMNEEQPTAFIDPNLTIIAGSPYNQTYTNNYFQNLDSTLICNDKHISEHQQGISFFGHNHYQSKAVNYQQQLWPKSFWSFLQPDTINCQYHWQLKLYQGKQLTPILLLDTSQAPIMRSSFTLQRP